MELTPTLSVEVNRRKERRMFVTVKALTTLMDNNLIYIAAANESKEQHEEAEYNEYMEMMKTKLQKQLEELKRISSNQRLIANYETKTANAFQKG